MELGLLNDFANEANDEIGKYRIPFTLSPQKIISNEFAFDSLNWESVSYGDAEIDMVPDDKRGVYAFVICHQSTILPAHGYVLYIGIAGRKSNRSLRARYKDYLNQRKVLKRAGIAYMIGTWHEVLRFFFVAIDEDTSSEELEKLEEQLNTALLPPYSIGDLEADTKRKRRAFP